ncbi:probable G-protein coupled receptor 83 [Nephila pilipes]|uniref:Probable G-protein coupled receptor 83 n=1 Tax=Nephila pilipes TaxID=299642 RepID=A0A8X6QV58_NEPPI|nr:probable G-protein coupled receptor 83 [Nephila pilipes]
MDTTSDPLNVTDVFKLLMIWRNISQNWSSTLKGVSSIKDHAHVIVIFYSLIILISIFGNLLVCNIVARNRKMRSSTYVFIANLALSDFLTTVLNLPFNIARILFDHWPFGSFMCSFVPLVQVTSVYVSTFTMTCIAIDRYRIISKPLEPRLRSAQAVKIIAGVWFLALLLSLPHAIYNRIEIIFTLKYLMRCRAVYPPGTSRWITLVAVFTQYVLPLTITGTLYYLIIVKVWSRNSLGVVTEGQMYSQAQAKKRTIKMLVAVVILFALCWLPLNIFNILREFNSPTRGFHRSVSFSTVFFICHWLAMSSVCYNPFIYCWLNDNFKAGALSCLQCSKNAGRQLSDNAKSAKLARHSSVPTTTAVFIDHGFHFKQDSQNNSCGSNVVYTSDRKCNLDRRRSNRRQQHEFEASSASSAKNDYRSTTQSSLQKKIPFSRYNSEVTTTLLDVELRDLKNTIN